MKKLFLMSFLFSNIFLNLVHADWNFVGRNDDVRANVYVDKSAIKINGNTAQMPYMHEYFEFKILSGINTPAKYAFYQGEFICGENKGRSVVAYLDINKKVLYQDTALGQMEPINRTGTRAMAYSAACQDVQVQAQNNQPTAYYDFQIAEWAGFCAAIFTYGSSYYSRVGNTSKAKQFSDGAQRFFNFNPYKQTIRDYQSHFKSSYDINIGTPKLSLDIANMANSPQIFTDYLDGEVRKCTDFVATLAKQKSR